MKIEENNTVSWGKLMISELRTFQTYEHPRFPGGGGGGGGGGCNSEVLLYCCSCVCSALNISKQRLARQRIIKRQMSQHPIVEMTKAEGEEQALGDYVIMPNDEMSLFKIWWGSVPPSSMINVRFPHAQNGNAGKPSNSAKKMYWKIFLHLLMSTASQMEDRKIHRAQDTISFLNLRPFRLQKQMRPTTMNVLGILL